MVQLADRYKINNTIYLFDIYFLTKTTINYVLTRLTFHGLGFIYFKKHLTV